MGQGGSRPLIVLDDDPTGAQAVVGVPVLLRWDEATLEEALADAPPAVHLVTNSRAFPPDRAYEVVLDAARTALRVDPAAPLLLRGDSTLRAHFLEEYRALRDASFPGQDAVVLLVPALPAAGRVTIGGVHHLVRGGRRIPLHETEYARDPSFAYRDARLLDWAEERSAGFFRAAEGVEVGLDELRRQGSSRLAEVLIQRVRQGGAGVVVPDAETVEDLEIIAEAYRIADAECARSIVVRSAPTLVGVLGGNAAPGSTALPAAGAGVVVICGSHVPLTTRQVQALTWRFPGTLVEVDLDAMTGPDADREVVRIGEEASGRLSATRLAVVATPREVPGDGWDLERGEMLAWNLGRVLQHVAPRPGVVLAKGGITSAVTVQAGLGARRADVVGPVADGIALWDVHANDGQRYPYIVFPGNVGDDATLRELVERILVADPSGEAGPDRAR